ncbi:MAG TPA: hypothetical protein K8U79_09860 [Clostridium perfringens]|nr:hypothetical protein [Clostridium perfringens]
MYTLEELVNKVDASEEQIIDWLKRNEEFIGENGYSDEVLEKLIKKFGRRLVYKPIQTSQPQQNDDGPDFDF